MSDFNWEEFHKQLDIALSIMIQETDRGLSTTSLVEFARYSNEKRLSEDPPVIY
jgi:hypothetical protein